MKTAIRMTCSHTPTIEIVGDAHARGGDLSAR